jgi:hypothetical protein
MAWSLLRLTGLAFLRLDHRVEHIIGASNVCASFTMATSSVRLGESALASNCSKPCLS